MTKKNISQEHSGECSSSSPQARAEDPAKLANAVQLEPETDSSGQNKAAAKKPPASKKTPASPAAKLARKRTPQKNKKRGARKKKKSPLALRVLLVGLESGALLAVGVAVLMVLLGYGGEYLTGTSFFHNLLPFALAGVLIVVAGTVFARGWWLIRAKLGHWHPALAPILAFVLAIGAGLLVQGQHFDRPLAQFRLLVGGNA